ncbi:leucyl/phenylalanyl-tRNA--protein transferase [Sphingobacterium sp. HJSM2_6]|uniref:leucyl/phenylalanyl-tRNA--protein transferase n=1 Tax=Sphingobacterium sp. HJSM2_6 TaxID=3366264 RepID=UPI003BE50F93
MIFWLDDKDIHFPDPSLSEPDGLLAVGGDLQLERLLEAYQHGIFPWYDEDSPILWYAPQERFVLYPEELKLSKSLRKTIQSRKFEVKIDYDFPQVIRSCATIDRKDQDGTWIIQEMQEAYIKLHQAGYAHSIETWLEDELVGGLYGVQIGNVFCGESMFSKVADASKVALAYLAQEQGLDLIDCQIHSDHLERLGARMIPQKQYFTILQAQKL